MRAALAWRLIKWVEEPPSDAGIEQPAILEQESENRLAGPGDVHRHVLGEESGHSLALLPASASGLSPKMWN